MTDAPDVSATTGLEMLPCGRDPLDVVDRALAGQGTPHEHSCPHCLAVIAEAAPATRAAAELSRTERDTAVPDTLLPDVMRTVWSELRRSTSIPVPIDVPTATAAISSHAAAALLERALQAVEEVQVRTCSVSIGAGGEPSVASRRGEHAPGLRVAITAAAGYRSTLPALAARVRDIVERTITEQLGCSVEGIDIDIVDLVVPEELQP